VLNAGTSRRAFCSGAASLLLTPGAMRLAAQSASAGPVATPIRPDVAVIDHDRILAAAGKYLTEQPTPLTSLPCPRSPGTAHDYYSEMAAESEKGQTAKISAGPLFTAHRDALFAMGLAVPALTAAEVLTGDAKYGGHAALHLRAWFVDPGTRMAPRMDYGAVRGEEGGSFEGTLETLPLVEVAQAIPFLAGSGALTEAEVAAIHAWFADYLKWLTAAQNSGPRLAALARDRKDHHGSSWLLQVSAYTLLTAPENGAPKNEGGALTELRHRFRTVTLRAQISSDGMFRNELSGATPYRDSLFNLDMLAAVCLLLTTRFESVWEYQLEDGPGMRVAIAYHFPFIADRAKWPYRADASHFTELPGRRASLLFCARAYQRPEYASLWKTLPPDPASPEVLRTVPIHQPLLWVRQPSRPA